MSSVTVTAPAKINLTLDVLGIRPDGYHEIASVMQTISLADKVTVSSTSESTGITLNVSGPLAEEVPTDERNLVWRAAEAIGVRDVAIHIEKNIPSQAGLGGGSSDAAAALLALNQLFGQKRTRAQLAEIGASLGADIPFFLFGGTARVEGLGERVTPLEPYPGFTVVIVKPPVGVSTAEAYRLLDEQAGHQSAHVTARWPGSGLSNDFEEVIYPRFPTILAARDALLVAGASHALLCGSGSAVFGTTDETENVAKRVEETRVGQVYIARTVGKGAQ